MGKSSGMYHGCGGLGGAGVVADGPALGHDGGPSSTP